MAGYVPLFDSLTKGTLCGKWPDIGLWPIVLSMGDKNGIVDATPQFIAGVTGLPIDDVIACMARFCQPDPYSRSLDANGARLVLLDTHREWGWQIVNHKSYREKARKQMQQIAATESGRDAERKRIEREQKSGGVQPRPAVSGADRPSDSDSDSDSERVVEAAKAEMAADGALARALIPLGVSVTSIHPTLVAWVRDGITVERAVEAVSVARQNKTEGNIPANYLDRILRQPQRGPPEKRLGKFDRLKQTMEDPGDVGFG